METNTKTIEFEPIPNATGVCNICRTAPITTAVTVTVGPGSYGSTPICHSEECAATALGGAS